MTAPTAYDRNRHGAASAALLRAALPAVATGWAAALPPRFERDFRRLTPDRRTAVVLHHYLGLSLPEEADAIGVPLGTAKSRVHHATRALRAALEADARGGGHMTQGGSA
ncbi:MAG TPA: sigma factor-like helix-turn-helix DNA-binding protein [Egibacteraceae bacterium]|nr:sigma factor-like helix-turn-helix DNA-binding protein [Egibacteraceae bacterium]